MNALKANMRHKKRNWGKKRRESIHIVETSESLGSSLETPNAIFEIRRCFICSELRVCESIVKTARNGYCALVRVLCTPCF